jgi:hypothetical protein
MVLDDLLWPSLGTSSTPLGGYAFRDILRRDAGKSVDTIAMCGTKIKTWCPLLLSFPHLSSLKGGHQASSVSRRVVPPPLQFVEPVEPRAPVLGPHIYRQVVGMTVGPL